MRAWLQMTDALFGCWKTEFKLRVILSDIGINHGNVQCFYTRVYIIRIYFRDACVNVQIYGPQREKMYLRTNIRV